MTKTAISFKVDDKPVKFNVIHNLPNTFGMSIECALENWLARTKTYTALSLCRYIMSKDESLVAMTESQFKRLNS